MSFYSFQEPVTELRMFFGYHHELERIVNKVAALGQNRHSFFIVGSHKMGKTSLLFQARQRLKLLGPERLISGYQQVLIPLYIDVLTLADPTPKSFFSEVIYKLASHLINTSFSFDIPNRIMTSIHSAVASQDPLGDLEDVLHALIEAAYPKPLRVILLIDDLKSLKSHVATDTISINLRALHIDPLLENALAYIITGNYHDLKQIRTSGSPLENILYIDYLHVFDQEQSLALINKPTEGRVPQEVAHLIYRESGGHPFLLQYLMSILCERENLLQLKGDDVFQATERFLLERKDFEHWWGNSGEVERYIYQVFCQNKSASVDELAQIVQVLSSLGESRHLIVRRGMILDSLHSLGATGLIREVSNETYELAGELPARWFLRMNQSYM